MRGIFLATLGLLISAAGITHGQDGSPPVITVSLASGRTFSGIADRRSDEDQLWLRVGGGTASITRPIFWSAIVDTKQADKSLTKEDVLNLAQLDDGRSPATTVVRQIEPGRIVIQKPFQPVIAVDNSQQSPAIPASLRVDAAVENFDGDTENDGLAVQLWMLDQRGRTIPFEGTARIRWVGPQARKNTAQSPPHGVVLGDWTVPVTSDGSSRAVVAMLPFQSRNPERDLTLYNYSLVEVTLTIPGVGNFAAEKDGIRIRRWEPYRDFNQVPTNGPIVNRSSRRP